MQGKGFGWEVATAFSFFFSCWDHSPGAGASIFNHKKLITVLHILSQKCSPLNNSGPISHQRYKTRCALKSYFFSFPEPPASVCLYLLHFFCCLSPKQGQELPPPVPLVAVDGLLQPSGDAFSRVTAGSPCPLCQELCGAVPAACRWVLFVGCCFK